jgi:hypothetical protein
MMRKGALVIAAIIVVIAITVGLYASGMDDQITIGGGGGGGINSNIAEVVIKSDVAWSADIKDSESRSHLVDGFGDRTIPIISLTVQKSERSSGGTLNVEVVKKESGSQRSSTTSANGIISLSGTC